MATPEPGFTAFVTERPDPPSSWIRARKGSAWHHVFPYARLRDIWNALIRTSMNTRTADAYNALRRYIQFCGRELRDVDGVMARIRSGSLSFTEYEALSVRAVWHRWNIVEGYIGRDRPPQDDVVGIGFRLDNPRDEELDKFAYGLTRGEFRRMCSIRNLFYDQEGLQIPAMGNLPLETLGRLRELFELYSPHLVDQDLVPFRDGMWESVAPRCYIKRNRGEQFIPG